MITNSREIKNVLHFIFLIAVIDTEWFKSFSRLDEVCFSSFLYTHLLHKAGA